MPFFLGFGVRGGAAARAPARCCSTRNANARLNLWLDWQLRRTYARAQHARSAGLAHQDQQRLDENPRPQRGQIEVGERRNEPAERPQYRLAHRSQQGLRR